MNVCISAIFLQLLNERIQVNKSNQRICILHRKRSHTEANLIVIVDRQKMEISNVC